MTSSPAVFAESAPRIETTVSPACEVAARDLEGRLHQALGAQRGPELAVSIAIEDDGVGYRVTLVTADGSERGEKVITAPTCDEAVDAAVVVLALATSEATEEEPLVSTLPEATPNPPARALEPEPRRARWGRGLTDQRDGRVDGTKRDQGVETVESSSSRGASSRASLATGIDAGTLPSPTLVVSAGFAGSFSALEVRGLARYGLPFVEETTETGFYESVRRDFGALELRACYGVGVAVRLLACSGAELGAVRVTRRVEDGETDVDEDDIAPRLSGVFAALVRHQGGAVQPELEVSGSAVAVGRQESSSPIAIRVSAGAALEF